MTERIQLSEREKRLIQNNTDFIATGQDSITNIQAVLNTPEFIDVPTAEATLNPGQFYTLISENIVRVVPTPP